MASKLQIVDKLREMGRLDGLVAYDSTGPAPTVRSISNEAADLIEALVAALTPFTFEDGCGGFLSDIMRARAVLSKVREAAK